MNIIIKARRAVVKFGGVSGASVALGIPRSTLRDWLSKPATKRQETPPKTEPAKGQWMQSLHHDCAHFIRPNGLAACHGSPTGAKIIPGMQWMPSTGLRQCRQCMAHAT